MKINLSKDLKQFVHDAIRAGRYATEDDVIRDALIRLKRAMPEGTRTDGQRTKSARAKNKPLTPGRLHRNLCTE